MGSCSLTWGVVALVGLSCVGACSWISGVQDLQEIGPADASLQSDSPPDSPQPEGGRVEASPADGCPPAGPEVCSNGIDDDCNGLVDCADPACAAFRCVAAAPGGWSLVALDGTDRAPCPAGYSAPMDLVVDPDLGPEGCACTCGPAASTSCDKGSVQYRAGGDPTCSDAGVSPKPSDGLCDPMAFGPIAGYHEVAPLPPSGANGCTPMVTSTTPPAPAGRACSAAAVGGGCSAGQVCAPSAGGAYAVCLATPGKVSCPAAFPKPHAAGTGIADTRACGSCTCGAPSCGSATFTWYSDTACATSVMSIAADGMCHPTPGAPTAAAYKYAATVICPTPTPPPSTGSASLEGLVTVCCQ